MKLNIDQGMKILGLERKFIKLRKNPELFVKDMVFKRSNQVKKYVPLKYKSENKYTIVSAVYNVSSYLDDYFKSIISQTISFNKCIYIICVDDGSTDDSAKIIKKWQKKYPKNICYIYKENGGQASARNLALEHVATDWVTFVDPDDFLSPDYFYELDKSIIKNEKVKMLVSSMHFYFEKDKTFKDSHPLRYRFSDNNTSDVNELGNNINLSASSTLFSTPIIKNKKLKFDSRIKPNFEDGKFIADYLRACNEGQVMFVKSSIYFYRKRVSTNSTLDTAWQSEKKYDDVIRYGYIPMMQEYKAHIGVVPKHIQRTVLYDISWYVKYLRNKDEKVNFLTLEQKATFISLIRELFTYIDIETIISFNLIGIWFLEKVGMLGCFKQIHPSFQIAYIEKVDQEKKQILLHYFTFTEVDVLISLSGKEIIPKYHKKTIHTFAGEKFVIENRVWLPFYDPLDKGTLQIIINGQVANISLVGKNYKNTVLLENIIKSFQPEKNYKKTGSWIFMDRDQLADDNAEHLYRYVMRTYPNQEIIFALRKNSIDWHRLHKEGFNLIDYDSVEFASALRGCDKIISSQMDEYIYDYFGDEYELSKKFIFLQHGVIHNNLSNWFNKKNNLDCVITTTGEEYKSIAGDFTPYKLTKKEVFLTGLPRHDSLIKGNQIDKRVILVMPTWRKNIVGSTTDTTNGRSIKEGFLQTEYAKNWYSFLHSKDLKKIVDSTSYKVIFAPHANIIPYLLEFNLPTYIQIWLPSDKDTMQSLFQQAKIMITDYSSVAFEMGYLSKLVLYYQFDSNSVLNGDHTFQKGYFDYVRDGFGPVATSEPELLNELGNILKNDGVPFDPYLQRMQKTFPFKDGLNCERVYQAILSLSKPDGKNVDIDMLEMYINTAYQFGNWEVLKIRCELFFKEFTFEGFSYLQDIYLQTLLHLKKWNEIISFCEETNTDGYNWLYYYTQRNWVKTLAEIKKSPLSSFTIFIAMQCSGELGRISEFCSFAHDLSKGEKLSENLIAILKKVYILLSERDWKGIIELLENQRISSVNTSDKYSNGLDNLCCLELILLLSRAYRKQGLFKEALNSLNSLAKEEYDEIVYIERAKINYNLQNFDEVIHLLKVVNANQKILSMSENTLINFSTALFKQKELKYLHDNLDKWLNCYPSSIDLRLIQINLLIELELWKEIIELNKVLGNIDILAYATVLSYYRLGEIEKAYESVIIHKNKDNPHYLKVASEIATLVNDFELAESCLQQLISRYANVDRKENWDRYQQLILLKKMK